MRSGLHVLSSPAPEPSSPSMIRVAHLVSRCRTLGPGTRGVIWVAGCERRCPGCIADPILGRNSGARYAVQELAQIMGAWPDIEGVTLSGGEPFEQADALAELCSELRRARGLSVVAYTGYTIEEIERGGVPGHARLLEQVDILIDGPFVESRRANLLWRGSSNQRVLFLSDRYRFLSPIRRDEGVGVEVHVSRDMRVFWAGVPEPRFHERLVDGLSSKGIELEATDGIWS